MYLPFTSLVTTEPLGRLGDVPPGRYGSVFTNSNVGFGNYVTPIDSDVSAYVAGVTADGGVAMSYKDILNLNSFVRLCKANGAWDKLQLAYCSQWGYKLGAGGVSKIYCVKQNRHAEQATAAAQPAYNATGFSGKPAWIFDGVDDWFSCENSGAILNNASSCTVFGVGYRSSEGTDKRLFHVNAPTGVRAAITTTTGWTAQARRLDGVGAVSVNNNRFSSTAPCISVAEFDWANAVMQLWLNRGTPGVLNPFLTAGNVSATDSTQTNISRGGTAVGFWLGPISAVLQFVPALTTTQRQEVEQFFATLYGITLDP